jgi:hypothetical protein
MIDLAPPPIPAITTKDGVQSLFLPIKETPLHILFAKDHVSMTGSDEENAILAQHLRANEASSELSPLQKEVLGQVGQSGFFLLLAENSGVYPYLQRMIVDPMSLWGSASLRGIARDIGYLADVRAGALILGRGEAGERFFPHVPSVVSGAPVRVEANSVAIGGFRLSDSGQDAQSMNAPTLPSVFTGPTTDAFLESVGRLHGFALLLTHADREPGLIARLVISEEKPIEPSQKSPLNVKRIIVIVFGCILLALSLVSAGILYRRSLLRHRTVAEKIAAKIDD